jgi:hypothetical protein
MSIQRQSPMRWLVFCAFAALVSSTVSAAQSFVYLAAPVCVATPVCAPEVLVYDAVTGGLVTRIPLTVGTTPSALAISPDGRRLYVSSFGIGGGITVIDTTRHVSLGTPVDTGGGMAVSRDGTRLFIVSGNGIFVYDTATDAIVSTIRLGSIQATDVAASPTADRFYVALWNPAAGNLGGSGVAEYDTATLALVAGAGASFDVNAPPALHVSRDGTRVYVSHRFAVDSTDASTIVGTASIFDPSTWASIGRFTVPEGTHTPVDSVSRRRIYAPATGGISVRDFDTFDERAFVPVTSLLPSSVAISADETRGWFTTWRSPFVAGSANTLQALDLATNTITSIVSLIPGLPGAPSSVVATPPGASVCNYQVDTTQSSWTVNGGTASIALKTPCTWAATSNAPWARLSSESGSGDATLTLTVDQNFTTTNRSVTLSIGGRLVHVTQASFSATPGFGFIDAPADNTAGVSGALNVSGWALDDVGVTRVRVLRDPVAGETPGVPVFIGDATFVDGARPDVQSFFPAFPNASRAGWGLQILTNVLPGQGNGTYRLQVFADDVEGHTTLLGTRTFTAANTSALLPFGTIDTPAQGETVAGTIVNFGWALAPPPKMIAADGSTIDVLIDGVVVGHPTYGFARGDIQALFPGYANTDGAVGYFILDTTTLTNGLHSIAWVVHDNMGATEGIGSRFFTVDNP